MFSFIFSILIFSTQHLRISISLLYSDTTGEYITFVIHVNKGNNHILTFSADVVKSVVLIFLKFLNTLVVNETSVLV